MKSVIALFASLTAFCYWTGEYMPQAYSVAPTPLWQVMGCILLALSLIQFIKYQGKYEGEKPYELF